MAISPVPLMPQGGIPSLQALAAAVVSREIDGNLKDNVDAIGVLKATSPSSLSLTTANIFKCLGSLFNRSSPSLAEAIPWVVIDLIQHPHLLVDHQIKEFAEIQKKTGGSPQEIVLPEMERIWCNLCEVNGYSPKGDELEMTWEQRYFKERIAKILMQSCGNFEKVDPTDWELFYKNRSRIRVLEINNNPYIKNAKLKEVCALFSEITHFKVSNCSGMEEVDWIYAFSELKKMVHVDLGINMTIGSRAIRVLAKNSANIRSLNLYAVDYCIGRDAIIHLLRSSPRLESLILGQRKNLCELSQLLQVLSACSNVTSLELRDFKSLKPQDVEIILKTCPGIVKLVFTNCLNLGNRDARIFLSPS